MPQMIFVYFIIASHFDALVVRFNKCSRLQGPETKGGTWMRFAVWDDGGEVVWLLLTAAPGSEVLLSAWVYKHSLSLKVCRKPKCLNPLKRRFYFSVSVWESLATLRQKLSTSANSMHRK